MPSTKRSLVPALGALLTVGALAPAAFAAPAPTITSPAKNMVTIDRGVHVAASAPGAACMSASVEDDATRAQVHVAVASGAQLNEAVTVPGDGRYRVVVSATDSADCNFAAAGGSIGRDTASFTVDSTPPAPFSLINQTRTCPGGGACLLSGAATLDLEWNRAEDANGIAHYEILVDGTERARTDRRRFSLPMAGIANLSAVEVVAVDIAGNRRAASPAARILHDTTAPTVRWTGPTSPWLRGRVQLSARVADEAAGSGLRHFGFTTRKVTAGVEPRGDIGLVADPSGDTTAQPLGWGSKSLPDGRHQLSAFAVDHAGNVSHATRTFTVDNTRPKFANRARVMKVSASRSLTRVPVKVSDELSPRLIVSYVVRDTKRSTKPAKLQRAQRAAVAKAQRALRVAKRSDNERRIKAATTRLANARIALANRYVRKATGAHDRGTQRVAIPGRSLGVGNYRLTLQVKDLAGNTATRAYTLMVR